MDHIAMLQETLQILDQGAYEVNGKTVKLKLGPERMERCHVLLPEDVRKVCSEEMKRPFVIGRCGVSCVPMDSFAAVMISSGRPSFFEMANALLLPGTPISRR